MRFVDWLAKRLQRRVWVVAERMTPRLRREGYDIAISRKMYASLETEWARENPEAVLQDLPRHYRDILEAAGLLNIPKGEA